MKRVQILIACLVVAVLILISVRLVSNRKQARIDRMDLAQLQEYVKSNSSEPAALLRLGMLERKEGDNAVAEKTLRSAIQLDPANEMCWLELSRTQLDDKAAIDMLQTYLKLDPDSANAKAELAQRLLQTGAVDDALKLATEATQVDPNCSIAWRSLAGTMAARENLTEAEADFKKSLSLKDDPDTRLALARFWVSSQRYREIIDICSPLFNPANSYHLSPEQRARALLYNAGAQLYQPMSGSDIISVQTQLTQADMLADQLPPAERFLPAYFIGESYLILKKPADAIPYLERSAKKGPMFAGSLYSLARAYTLVGNTASAAEAMAKHRKLTQALTGSENPQSR